MSLQYGTNVGDKKSLKGSTPGSPVYLPSINQNLYFVTSAGQIQYGGRFEFKEGQER